MFLTTVLWPAVLLGGSVLAAPAPTTIPSDARLADIQACRAQASSALEECACFPGCEATQTEHGYTFTMADEAPFTNTSASALNKRGGCPNPRAYVTMSSTIINMGSTPPYNLYSSVFEQCHQSGCDPNPVTKSTIIIGMAGGPARTANARIIAKGLYRDWPDRDAACSLLRESSLGDLDVQWRRQGVHCRPGVDCDPAPAIPQYYQRNYYQVDHWNECGLQAHVEAEVKIDGEDAFGKVCTATTGSVNGVIGWLAAKWGWLFGAIQAVC